MCVLTSPALRPRRLLLLGHRSFGDVTGKEAWKMKIKIMALTSAVLAAAVVLIAPPAWAAGGHIGFGFNARGISGFPTGAATLTGRGSYHPPTGFPQSARGFPWPSHIPPRPLPPCPCAHSLSCA